jgi:hypothetical protein
LPGIYIPPDKVYAATFAAHVFLSLCQHKFYSTSCTGPVALEADRGKAAGDIKVLWRGVLSRGVLCRGVLSRRFKLLNYKIYR